jgi:hypothetical protein
MSRLGHKALNSQGGHCLEPILTVVHGGREVRAFLEDSTATVFRPLTEGSFPTVANFEQQCLRRRTLPHYDRATDRIEQSIAMAGC